MLGNPSDKNTGTQNNNTSMGLFGNIPSNTQNKPTNSGLFGSSTGGFFGSTTAPSGGLFSSNTPSSGGFFSGTNTSTMKTTQRKQGGLFANSSISKPSCSDEAPKLLFGGIGGNPPPNTLFGATSNISTEKKDQNGGQLFGGKTTGSFFGNNTPPPNFFGNTPNETKAKEVQKKPQSSGLFSSVNQDKKQKSETKQQKPNLSFGNPSGTLFGNTTAPSIGQKKETGGLFGNTGGSTLFSGLNQGSTLFGSSTKKQDEKKVPQGFLNSSTPSTPLFGQKSPAQNPLAQQKPSFSLAGGITSTPIGSGGLFGKKEPDTKLAFIQTTQTQNKEQKPEVKPAPTSLFNLAGAKNDTEKSLLPPTLGSGGLFGTQKIETKPVESSSLGLFNNDKKECPPILSGGLFGSNTDQNKPKDNTGASSLFDGNSSLFAKQTPKNEPEPDQKKPVIQVSKKIPSPPKEPQISENLLATFSKQKINDVSTAGEPTENLQKRTNRTISFNEPLNQSGEGPTSNIPPTEAKPTTTGVLFQNTQPIPSPSDNKKDTIGMSMKESLVKPSTVAQTESFLGPTSNLSKSQKMMHESFFKPVEILKKEPSSPIIWTAFEINNLLKEELLKKSSGPSRYGEKPHKNFTKNIEEWIEASFTRFNQGVTSEQMQKKFSLHSNDDINRFLNDIVREVVLVGNLPIEENSFKLVNKLFFELLDKLGIKQYLFNCTKIQIPQNQSKNFPLSLQIVQLNTSYFTKHQIYKFTPEGIMLNLNSEELQKYILTLTKKFITNQLEYLEYIQNKTDMLKMPSRLFYHLLTYCLQYKKIRLAQMNVWKEKNSNLVGLVQDFEKKIFTKIVSLLSGFVDSTFYDFLLINKQLLPEFIQLVENFSYTEEEEIIHLSLKVILNNLGMGISGTSGKQQIQLNSQLISLIKETKSLQLLPFRTLAAIHQNKGYRTSPSAHDLYRYINGAEWLDWLEIYLGNNSAEKEISLHQAKYIIKILKYPIPTIKRVMRERITPKQARYMQSIDSRVLNRKRPIYKYIMSLREENMLNIFYEILTSIVYDYESYRKVQEVFFKQKHQFNYQFRNVIAEICNYPTQKFTEQIPFLEDKLLYFLRIVQVAPERTFSLEKLVFQGTPIPHKKTSLKDDTIIQLRDQLEISEIGHKICHFIIDTINYFGLKNNQKIVSKCISAVKSLLQNDETSLSMKIAMAVNKPEMLFISSSLLAPNQYRLIQNLVVEMTELLEFMLISEEFPQTLALCLYTNNSEDVHLEKMYSVRYSSKDYLPFARELMRNHFNNKKLARKQVDNQKITITFSSYWILKCLEVLVQGFRQEKSTSTTYGKNLLYMLSLILEKLFVPISHPVKYQEMSSKMMEESIQKVNNPIYSTSSSGEIPKVLLYLGETLNAIDIMSILSQNLKYKLLNTVQTFESKNMTRSVKYCLVNEKLEDDFEENQFAVYLSVKILKQILQLYRVYEQFKHAPLKVGTEATLESAENHFVYKLLTRFKWIQDLEFNLFLKGFSKMDLLEEENNSTTNLIIGLITLLMENGAPDKSNPQIEGIFQSTPINLKEHNYKKPFVVPIESSSTLSKKSSTQLSNFSQVQNFYIRCGQTLNFESINNFLINSTSMYLESYQSIECLVIQSLGLMVSGEGLFGTRACNTGVESSINIGKFIGFYSSLEVEVFSNMWLLENFESQLYCLLSSRNTSLQLKQAILDFLYQVIKNHGSSNNFILAKKVFYKYLVKHLDQFSFYSEDQINRLNNIVIKILNLLEEKDYFIIRKQCNDRLIDALIGAILKTCEKCFKSTGNLLKLIRSFKSKLYYPAQFAYYHLERTYEQREIIKTAEAYDILKGVIDLVEKRFFDGQSYKTESLENSHKWKCIRKINSLIIALNLPYIAPTINDSKLSQLSIEHIHQQETNKYYFNTNLPHSFAINPYELYLTQAKTLSYIEVAFDAYKQNLIDWLSFASMRLGERILKFLNWVLTVDRSLYGNQPIVVRSKQIQSSKEQNILCSMHMGSYRHTAVQLFAQTQNQAINLVKTLFDQSLRNLEKGMTVSQAKCFSIMGYCLEWIRARQKTQNILEHLVRNTIRNPFWVDQNTLKNHFVIKFILSLVNIGSQTLDIHEFKSIHRSIFDMIQKFREGKSQLEQSLIQEMISILISIPPQLEDISTIHQIINIWKGETNNEYFYNQCRLVLELCQKYPNQIAKIKVLRNCQKIKKAVSNSHYSYNLRFPDSISFIWGLKIASTLMSSEMETVLIFQEITEFYNMKSEQIYSLLLRNTSTISLVHIEELQALLQFILTLVSSQSWVTVHRKEFEKLTYVLSHKLINLFMDFINSKITFVAESDMERRFKKIRYESYADQLKEQAENQVYESGIEKNSVFRMFAEVKMVECIKIFTLVLSRSFEQSWYVHKYFNEEVYQNYRYGVSFWDRMNKCIMDLIRFNINVEKKWRKSENLNQKLLLIQDCINSSQFFVETGYLSSLYSIPLNSKELFEEFEELNRVSLELGNVHLIQEKTFRLKYQCLMKGNIQKFGKKLMENAKMIQDQVEQRDSKIENVANQTRTLYIEKFSRNLVNLIKTV